MVITMIGAKPISGIHAQKMNDMRRRSMSAVARYPGYSVETSDVRHAMPKRDGMCDLRGGTSNN